MLVCKPTRRVDLQALHATRTKKKLGPTSNLSCEAVIWSIPVHIFAKWRIAPFLYIISQLFICELKTKDIFLFFPQFFTLGLQFWEVSFLFQQYLFFSTPPFYDRRFWKHKRTNSAWGKKKFNFFGRESWNFSFDLNNIIWFAK